MAEHNKTIKVIQSLRKIQFICEFFILSKVSEDSHVVTEFLTIVEAIKFYFKSVALAQCQNLYIEKVQEPKQSEEKYKDPTTVQEAISKEKQLLSKIKDKSYQGKDYHPSFFQELGNGKKIQLITSMEMPENLRKSKMKLKHLIGEILTLLRPLLSIISIRLFGIDSYKSYLFSLLIDLAIIVFFQRGLKTISKEERDEISERRSQVLKRYIFRKPLFNLLKSMVIVPVLKKFMKEERIVFGLVMSLLEMQSSVTLTL